MKKQQPLRCDCCFLALKLVVIMCWSDSLKESVIISKIDTLDVIVIIAVNDSLFNTAIIHYH